MPLLRNRNSEITSMSVYRVVPEREEVTQPTIKIVPNVCKRLEENLFHTNLKKTFGNVWKTVIFSREAS